MHGLQGVEKRATGCRRCARREGIDTNSLGKERSAHEPICRLTQAAQRREVAVERLSLEKLTTGPVRTRRRGKQAVGDGDSTREHWALVADGNAQRDILIAHPKCIPLKAPSL